MKRFLNSVAGRYTIFGLCLFLVVICVSMFEAYGRITVTFSDTDVEISSNRFIMQVDFAQIKSTELTDVPDRGESIGGSDDTSIRFGKWNNDVWGNYESLTIPHATNCIVLHLVDGNTYVFNARSNEYTAEIYSELCARLAAYSPTV